MKTHTSKILMAALVAAIILPLAGFAQTIAPGALAEQTADDYRKAARYPAHSAVLQRGAEDPVRSEHTPSKIFVGEGEGPVLAVWGAQVSYTYPAPIDFFVAIEGAEPAAITGEVVTLGGEKVGTLSFFDDGATVDKAATDGVFSGRVAMHKSVRPELAENYMVKIRATYADGSEQHATTGFLYSNPWAELTGRYRDRVVGGSLVIQAQVEVTRAGRFHAAGVLHTLTGEAIGTTQTAVELEPGKHWIDLSFYGLMFHDRGVQGPYRLGSLALRTTGAMPNALNAVVFDTHTTRAIPLKSLTTRPFGDADLMRAAEQLDAEAQRARGFELKNVN